MEIYDGLHVPLRFKGTKRVFDSRAPTTCKLNECTQFEVTSSDKWDPELVNLTKIWKLLQIRTSSQSIYMVKRDQLDPLSSSIVNADNYIYLDLLSDEALLSEVSPSLVQMKELSMPQVNVTSHDNEIFLAQQLFASR